jgi:hypothetical protein
MSSLLICNLAMIIGSSWWSPSARDDLAKRYECSSTSQLLGFLVMLRVDGQDGLTFSGSPEIVSRCRSCVLDDGGWKRRTQPQKNAEKSKSNRRRSQTFHTHVTTD